MRTIGNWLVAFVTRLCAIFTVTSESLVKGKRGNLPPPDGGISSY